ncbi:MAG: uracil-DNA glycosylase [Clostridia bacterium]|nr:uracil-DNA glycosylase [Clostridia bacterium]
MFHFGNHWDALLAPEYEKPYYQSLRAFLIREYRGGQYRIYPPMDDLFAAFRMTDYDDVKVVILGQDPYHAPGQAHGLCFSVRDGVDIPPSLINIYREMKDELGIPIPSTGNLTPWAKRGVLLLNSVLTVREGQAGSPRGKGWETFTDRAIELINEKETPVCFLLWGNYARSKKALVTNPNHLVLEAAHPSPLSCRGFFGCGHFLACNRFLGDRAVDWRLETAGKDCDDPTD